MGKVKFIIWFIINCIKKFMSLSMGKFVISLDFELQWGVRDVLSIENYGANIIGTHSIMEPMLDLFDKYNVNTTFATVGFLFSDSKEDMVSQLPKRKPNYTDKNLSPYENNYLQEIGENEVNDPYHFATSLLKDIHSRNRHEISTHTYSHYYCLEEGQGVEDFRDDIKAAITVAKEKGIETKSIVFPRNQINDKYLKVCEELGISCYRGNENFWAYKASKFSTQSKLKRFVRLIDSYINISGYNCYSEDDLVGQTPLNIPSSSFLRPYSNSLKAFEFLRLKRIKNAMTYAAKQNLIYHIWWHPHNFGVNQEENLHILEEILKHYQFLNKKFGFKSYTMSGLYRQLMN